MWDDLFETTQGIELVVGVGTPIEPGPVIKPPAPWYIFQTLTDFDDRGDVRDELNPDDDVGYQGFDNASDYIEAGRGDDKVFGNGLGDTLHGMEGDDELDGGDGNDVVTGGIGDDEIWGRDGQDSLFGGLGQDHIRGGADDDTIWGDRDAGPSSGQPPVRKFGDGAADTLEGDSGNDRMFGEGGDDAIFGGSDDDFLVGGFGDDRIRGGSDDDVIRGGLGDDILTGDGANSSTAQQSHSGGADTFVYASEEIRPGRTTEHWGADIITDFEVGLDHFDFSGHRMVDSIDDLTITVFENATQIAYGDGGYGGLSTILVQDVGSATGTALTSDDFIF
ncbi:MAG: hypothetical protein AAFQ42_07460 [Pseudomonadota bacterium]